MKLRIVVLLLFIASIHFPILIHARSGFGGGFAAGAVTGFFAPVVLGAIANGNNCNSGCNRPQEVVVQRVYEPTPMPMTVPYERAPEPQRMHRTHSSYEAERRAQFERSQAETVLHAQENKLEELKEQNRRKKLALQERRLALKERKKKFQEQNSQQDSK